jgi:DNA-binding NarL/FixJ family response regulator
VVIADDSALVRQRLVATLPELVRGLEVVGEASDVPGAIESARRLQPDALILDARMPGGSGLDVLRELKRSASAPLVMVFTSFPSAEDRHAYLAAGADFFFSKAKDIPELLAVLQRYSSAS